jgi:hypothetical protein
VLGDVVVSGAVSAPFFTLLSGAAPPVPLLEPLHAQRTTKNEATSEAMAFMIRAAFANLVPAGPHGNSGVA